MKRREFLTFPARTLGGTLLYSLAGEPLLLNAQQTEVRVPLRFFTSEESKIVIAAAERILPGGETGPGATDAGVVIYIDRQLAGPHGRDKYRYTKGPWVTSVPEHGNQSKTTPQELYREGLATLGTPFVSLPPDEQDRRLIAIEKTPFFQLLRSHTIEGMFCDPLHGGNAGMVGWQLIGFPGPLMSYRTEFARPDSEPVRRAPRSLEQITGRKIKGWEDEA